MLYNKKSRKKAGFRCFNEKKFFLLIFVVLQKSFYKNLFVKFCLQFGFPFTVMADEFNF